MKITRMFKGYFLRGLAVLLPTILTIWLFVWGYTFIQDNISIHINRGLVHLVALARQGRVEVSDEEKQDYVRKYKTHVKQVDVATHAKREDVARDARIRKIKDRLEPFWVQGSGAIAGFIIALIGVCMLGALLASYVGRRLWRRIEKFIMNTPFLRRVYPYVKQVTDFLLAQEEEGNLSFSRVVAVEYPRKGIWSVGLVTGSGLRRVSDTVKKEFITVLIPTSPTPFTGFVIMVPRKNTIDLDITIEQAFRFLVSGGVIAPDVRTAAGMSSSELPVQG